MKKVFGLIAVLFVVGMAFTGCQQPNDATGDEFKLATDATFEGDISWMVGTWKSNDPDVEVTFSESASQEVRGTKDTIITNTNNYFNTSSMKELTITDSNKETYANDIKSNNGKTNSGVKFEYYFNGSKTKMKLIGTDSSNSDFTIKVTFIYTKQ